MNPFKIIFNILFHFIVILLLTLPLNNFNLFFWCPTLKIMFLFSKVLQPIWILSTKAKLKKYKKFIVKYYKKRINKSVIIGLFSIVMDTISLNAY